MKIAIDASRAFLHERTGIEEYSYQLIKHLRGPLGEHHVTLFIRKGTAENVNFDLPKTWRVRALWAPRLWTYMRLSSALFFGRYERLFVPGHIVPPIHPAGTVVTVHGLEFEMTPEAFSAKERKHMRYGIMRSCAWAAYVICVSNNTKRDLMRLYKVPRAKIRVVYEGVEPPAVLPSTVSAAKILERYHLVQGKYILFVGRIEARKNIINILKTYEMLREHFHMNEKLVLVGKFGHGADAITAELNAHAYKADIVLPGFVSEEEKWAFLRSAGVFVFPTLYEGFGLPILEAQHVGVPVVTSNTSALPETVKDSALLVDPLSPAEIAESVHRIITDEDVRNDLIAKGTKNLARFSWDRAAQLTAKVILTAKK